MLSKNPKTIPTNPITVTYSAEYTNELEINPDYENIKKISNIQDLDRLIFTMFELRKQNKNNISIGYTITDNNNNWLIEDYCNDTEDFTNTRKEDKQQKKIAEQAETITELYNELELMKSFLTKYNALDRYNKEMKEDKNV